MAQEERPGHSRDQDEGAGSPIEAALKEYREAWYAGNPEDVDSFCRARPECGAALRDQIENFLLVARGLADAVGSAKPDPEDGRTSAASTTARVLGDFRILGEIGRGGNGVVYEAEQISLDRRVALKVLPAHLSFSEGAVMKFRREAVAGGRQSHPGIVAVYAVGEHEGVHFIAQELVEGGRTLADRLDRLRRERALPIGYFRQAAGFVADVADALAHAHSVGVIHRDVKPSNILLTKEGRPKVTDFGIAKIEDALALSRTGDFAGTPYYMSPEQVTSSRIGIDSKTDIYSLGVSLYEMLTLELPFEGETSQEVLKKILFHEPRDPRKLNDRVPRDLSVICLKALEKRPEERYGSMTGFADDLRSFLNGETIKAKPAGLSARLVKRVRRNPALSTAVAGVIVAVITLIVYALWSYPRIIEERDNAETQRLAALSAREEAEAERRVAIAAREDAETQRLAALEAKKISEDAHAAAELEAEKATAINEFLQTMLASPSPRKEGKEVKVVDLLERGLEGIESAFPGQPEIKAGLQNTIGWTYFHLGCYDDAEKTLTAAAELLGRILGEDHYETLLARDRLGMVLQRRGRYGEAEKLHRTVLDLRNRTLGADHELTLATRNNLALSLYNQGKLDEAERIARDSFEIYVRLFGEEFDDTLTAMNILGVVLESKGRLDEAYTLQRKAHAIRLRLFGASHPNTLNSMESLSRILCLKGKPSEAREFMENIIDVRCRDFGENHPLTLLALSNLASVLASMGETSGAADLLRRVRESQSLALSEDHPSTLSTTHNLAILIWRQGDLAEAEALLHSVLEARRRVLGMENPDTLLTLNELAKLFVTRNKPSDAEPIFQEAIAIVERTLPEENITRALFHRNFGDCLIILERYGYAEKQLLTSLEGLKSTLGIEHEQTQGALASLVTLYEIQGEDRKAAEFRALLKESGK